MPECAKLEIAALFRSVAISTLRTTKTLHLNTSISRWRIGSAAILANFCRYCPARFISVESSGDAMKQLDYERLAEQCSAQADAMQPGSERDALLARAKQYRSYAKMENWIASKELQPPVS